MLYFAYGSNLDCAQMQKRCPSTRFRCRAMLRNYQLVFTRYSKGRGCGVADIVASSGSEVWGVVYEVNEVDLANLDATEGYRPSRKPAANAYNRREAAVLEDGDPQKPLAVLTYFATPQDHPSRPSGDYKRLIVEGARFWNLPSHYLEVLERIEVIS